MLPAKALPRSLARDACAGARIGGAGATWPGDIRSWAHVALAALLLVAGCATPPPPPAVLNLTIVAGRDQNPLASGKAAAVRIRLFQLNAVNRFDHADVVNLVERDQQTLGPDWVYSEDVVVRPGQTKMLTRELRKGAQFLGMVVLFRDIDHATWRGTNPVPDNGPINLTLRTTKIRANLAPS